MSARDAVIVDAVRTPVGKRNGSLAGSHAVDLSAHVLTALVTRTGVDPAVVDDVIWGCVQQVGQQALNVARMAVLAAGWPESVPGTTIDRQCGSSQQSIHFAAAGLVSGQYDVAIAGGVEMMSAVPMGATARDSELGRPGGQKVRERYGVTFNQGSGAELMMTSDKARELGLTPLARVHTAVLAGDDPVIMLTAPIPATHRALKKAGLTVDDIGVFEVNEAFAPVPLAWLAETGADPARLNPGGGAIAIGHPLGASGARLMSALVHHMMAEGIQYGLQTMCEGGGMANATIIERIA